MQQTIRRLLHHVQVVLAALKRKTTYLTAHSSHKAKLSRAFAAHLRGKRVVCLDIPDNYACMQPELIALLERTAGPLLRR